MSFRALCAATPRTPSPGPSSAWWAVRPSLIAPPGRRSVALRPRWTGTCPPGLSDKRAHCIAGGLIARFCSPTEARLAGLGKELRDVFGAGDADWSDWQATRAGVRCAAAAADVASIIACCENVPPGTTTKTEILPP